MKKRILSAALALVLLCTALPGAAFAAASSETQDMLPAQETPADTEPLPPDAAEVPSGPALSEASDPAPAPVPQGEEETDPPSVPTTEPTAQPVQAILKEDHVRYLHGYPDRSLRPQGTLTRAQIAQMVFRLLENPNSGTGTCSYTDIPAGVWYEEPVRALCALGLFMDAKTFRPQDPVTRAELVTILTRLKPEAAGTSSFPDVPQKHWASAQIGAAVSLGWISGYPDGTFRPDRPVNRGEACTILNRVCGRTGDPVWTGRLLAFGLFPDVSQNYWAGTALMEAAVEHTPRSSAPMEQWEPLDLTQYQFTPGFHAFEGQNFYVNARGKLVMGQTLGAFRADADGALTQTKQAYRMPRVPYYSQIDNINAWVGCEAVSTLMGLHAKGYAKDVPLRYFLDHLPRSASDPEKGFVGSPYQPDPTKKTRTTIYPAKLAEYSNQFCYGLPACADFRGASVQQLRQELLAGNCVVGYMTLWWKAPHKRPYNIEGTVKQLVSNNHAVLVCGYDPAKGYFISDPYNYYNRGEVYQYWKDAATFDSIWNARKMGMVIR